MCHDDKIATLLRRINYGLEVVAKMALSDNVDPAFAVLGKQAQPDTPCVKVLVEYFESRVSLLELVVGEVCRITPLEVLAIATALYGWIRHNADVLARMMF